MKISIGSDHRGVDLKKRILTTVTTHQETAISWQDVGAFTTERSDYPLFAQKVCHSILDKTTDYGILICGSGVGMSLAANRFKTIYAALCWDEKIVQAACEDDGMNILVLSADFITEEKNLALVRAAVTAWRTPTFKEGRYKKRLEMIDSYKI